MCQSPPSFDVRINPRKIAKAKLHLADLINARAKELTKDKIGWWGPPAVTYALWLSLAHRIENIPDSELAEIVHFHLEKSAQPKRR